jgi:hypothetical protein
MTTAAVNLIKGDTISIETDYRDNLPVNMYAVERDILGAKGYMLCYPGLTQIGTGSGADRGANYNERLGTQYRVSGTKLISVTANGAVTELGTIPGSSQARMIGLYSFNTQGIIADGKFFLYDPTNGFREVTDTDLGAPIDGTWIDGYYFMTDGEYIFHTDLTDETSIDPLKFATAEFMPDPSNGISKTQDNKVMVWGRYSLEYFINVATANFAFQRVVTRAQKIGIVATHAKCEAGNSFYITGGYRHSAVAVYMIGIGSSVKVSTREVDKVLAQYTEPELSDMRMECRLEDDVTFIIVHLPNETLCFNVNIAESFGKEWAWAILKTGTGDGNYRAINGVFDARSSNWVYGDKLGTIIGKLDNTVFTQYGEIAEWLLYTPIMKLEAQSIDEIEIETIPGHTSFSDATVAISTSYNGLTFGTEWWNLYGEPSEYGQRFIIRQLGYVDDWIGFKFRGATKSRMSFALLKISYA